MISLFSSIRATGLIGSNVKVLLLQQCRCPMVEVSSGLKTRSLESRLGIPEKPKKPLTPFFQFMTEVRGSVAAAHPQLPLQQVVKAIGAKWETVDEKQKQIYMDKFKKEQARYLQERAQYDATLTDDQRLQLQELKEQISNSRVKSAERKRVRELGRPKRAMSPFLLYLVDAREKLPRGANQTYREWQKLCSETWTAMSDADKERYFIESRKLINKYSEDLLKWEEKMVRLGNVDLVRGEMLIEPPERKTRGRPVVVKEQSAPKK